VQPLLLAGQSLSEDAGLPLSDALGAEIGELRAAKRKLVSGGDLCKGVAYVKLLDLSGKMPSQLVHDLLSNSQNKLPAYISRIIPFDFVTSPHMRNATDLVSARIKPFFENLVEPTTWNMKFSRHAMSSVDQGQLLAALLNEIPERHEASVMSGEWTIIIDVTPVVCGMSVVRDFEKLCEYNVNKLAQLRNLETDE
jgi:hypothetical protein